MEGKRETKKYAVACLAFLILLAAGSVLGPQEEISKSERRHLAVRPEISLKTVLDGSYMKQLEVYLSDRMAVRDAFRSIKAETETSLLGKTDSGGYYRTESGIYKLETELKEKNVLRGAENFVKIAEDYFPKAGHYVSLIPDKSYYSAAQEGYPCLDYEKMETLLEENMGDAIFIPIADSLSADDYYRTDPHWRQECITDTAELLLGRMGRNARAEEALQTRRIAPVTEQFKGSYAGASAFAVEPEEINCVVDEYVDAACLYDYEKQDKAELYAWEAVKENVDAYDFFLWGARALLTVENPLAGEDGKRLILFRDSFGSSIAPLLLSGYREITLVDLRYVTMDYAASLLEDLEYDDVLFLYSSAVLNHSDSMRF